MTTETVTHAAQALATAGQACAIALNGVESPCEDVPFGEARPDPMPAIIATSATAIVHGLLAVAEALERSR